MFTFPTLRDSENFLSVPKPVSSLACGSRIGPVPAVGGGGVVSWDTVV